MLTLMWKRSLKRAAPPSSITSPCLGLKAKVIEVLISGFMLKSELLPLTPPGLSHPSPSHPSPPPWSATSLQVQHMIGNKNLTHFLFWKMDWMSTFRDVSVIYACVRVILHLPQNTFWDHSPLLEPELHSCGPECTGCTLLPTSSTPGQGRI